MNWYYFYYSDFAKRFDCKAETEEKARKIFEKQVGKVEINKVETKPAEKSDPFNIF